MVKVINNALLPASLRQPHNHHIHHHPHRRPLSTIPSCFRSVCFRSVCSWVLVFLWYPQWPSSPLPRRGRRRGWRGRKRAHGLSASLVHRSVDIVCALCSALGPPFIPHDLKTVLVPLCLSFLLLVPPGHVAFFFFFHVPNCFLVVVVLGISMLVVLCCGQRQGQGQRLCREGRLSAEKGSSSKARQTTQP